MERTERVAYADHCRRARIIHGRPGCRPPGGRGFSRLRRGQPRVLPLEGDHGLRRHARRRHRGDHRRRPVQGRSGEGEAPQRADRQRPARPEQPRRDRGSQRALHGGLLRGKADANPLGVRQHQEALRHGGLTANGRRVALQHAGCARRHRRVQAAQRPERGRLPDVRRCRRYRWRWLSCRPGEG